MHNIFFEFQTKTNMYKRPIPRRRGLPLREFVTTTLPGGAHASYWTPANTTQLIPSGHNSLVGEILDKMRSGTQRMRQASPWVPPIDYEFVASHMQNPEPFLARCRYWFAANQPKALKLSEPPPLINHEPIIAVFEKYARVDDGPKVPPVGKLEKAWREAGYSEERIAKALAWHAKMEATSEERQKVLDLVFAKFPSANKPACKPKIKKVIKVVKKKTPGTINE
jgi:hypothetical protein